MNVLKSYIRTAREEWNIKKIIAVSDTTLVPVSFSGFLLTTAEVASATGMIFLHYTAYTAPGNKQILEKSRSFQELQKAKWLDIHTIPQTASIF